jgi:hypothetical protein
VDGCTQCEVLDVSLATQPANGIHQVQRRPDGPLGIVLLSDRRAPYRHDRITDELLDGAAVAFDDGPACLEVGVEQGTNILGVTRLGDRGEADQVGEQDADHPSLGCRGGRRRRQGRRIGSRECLPAFAAEPGAGSVR